MHDETVWLTALQMAELFERDETTIRKHIGNAFFENEVDKRTTRKKCVLMVLSSLWLFINLKKRKQ